MSKCMCDEVKSKKKVCVLQPQKEIADVSSSFVLYGWEDDMFECGIGPRV